MKAQQGFQGASFDVKKLSRSLTVHVNFYISIHKAFRVLGREAYHQCHTAIKPQPIIPSTVYEVLFVTVIHMPLCQTLSAGFLLTVIQTLSRVFIVENKNIILHSPHRVIPQNKTSPVRTLAWIHTRDVVCVYIHCRRYVMHSHVWVAAYYHAIIRLAARFNTAYRYIRRCLSSMISINHVFLCRFAFSISLVSWDYSVPLS